MKIDNRRKDMCYIKPAHNIPDPSARATRRVAAKNLVVRAIKAERRTLS